MSTGTDATGPWRIRWREAVHGDGRVVDRIDVDAYLESTVTGDFRPLSSIGSDECVIILGADERPESR